MFTPPGSRNRRARLNKTNKKWILHAHPERMPTSPRAVKNRGSPCVEKINPWGLSSDPKIADVGLSWVAVLTIGVVAVLT